MSRAGEMFVRPALVAAMAMGLSSAAFGVIEIEDDATGGDCTKPAVAGRWDRTTKTCSLTQDLTDEVRILDNGITLDGRGHTLDGAGNLQVPIEVAGRNGVSVEEVKVTDFARGIEISRSSEIDILNNEITDIDTRHRCAVKVSRSTLVRVAHNTIHANEANGVCIHGGRKNRIDDNSFERNGLAAVNIASRDNVISDNVIEGRNGRRRYHGIRLRPSSHNLIWGNRISDHPRGSGISFAPALGPVTGNIVIFNVLEQNTLDGISVHRSRNNAIVCNDFTDHPTAADFTGGSVGNRLIWNNFFKGDTASEQGPAPLNTFSEPPPTGGNYWDAHPNCVDANNDGFCDAPYVFNGDQDALPHVTPIAWRLRPRDCLKVAGYLEPEPGTGAPVSVVVDPDQPALYGLTPQEAIPIVAVLEDEFVAADLERDLAYKLALYAEDVVISLPDGETLRTRQEIKQWLQRVYDLEGSIRGLQLRRVVKEEEGATVTGTYDHRPLATALAARSGLSRSSNEVRFRFRLREVEPSTWVIVEESWLGR